MNNLLKGKDVAQAINEDILSRTPALYERGIVPTLAIIRVGENPSDIAYERGAIKKAKELGLQPEKYTCPENMSQEDLIQVIHSINENVDIDGILLLQPLPKHIDSEAVRNTLAPEKDLDCISDHGLGKLFTAPHAGYAPCTAESCIEILKYYNIPIKGKKAVVIGRSMVIGKPVAQMLLTENATVTTCHTRTEKQDLISYCQNADIIIAAAGKENTVTAEMVSSKTTIIDVGINFNDEGKMVGDVDFEAVSPMVKGITPVPGGVGSVTTSLLMKHLVEAAERK
ncbi:methylenetetrahydrofolate dehydrogenase (NADP+)/methenyltetrahydrofolate cyclohydrolase [Clostridiales Family XIII bacterium PM5-7]